MMNFAVSEEDAFQISEGSVSHSVLSDLLANGNCSTEKQQEISGLLQYRVRSGLRVGEEDSNNGWKDTVWLDNADVGEHTPIHLHYQHSYTCDPEEYNGMSMLWLNGGCVSAQPTQPNQSTHLTTRLCLS